MKERALIVDDDLELLGILRKYLENHGLETISASNGAEALAAAAARRPDIIITDVEMPRMDGFALCRKIKDNKALADIPLVIMTGKKMAEADQVAGYGYGADDYVIKPFSYPVLLAKVKAMLRRASRGKKKEAIKKQGALELNLEARTIKLKGKPVKLTSKEFDLLNTLTSNPGRVLSLTSLLEAVWGYNTADYNDPHTVEVHVSNLRRKIGLFGKRIKAVPGHGYKFE
ncbi:MAG: response regulator transcription factor [Elusimicrobia bacterium]|jgi:DNA-binding response OmpR family regulator|nr:response regulator transcription factor [Elusimicrobiota bacterium]